MSPELPELTQNSWKIPLGIIGTSQLTGCDDTLNLINLLLNGKLTMWEINFNRYAPPPLSIDRLGWDDFLTLWSNESTELVRIRVFKHGLGGASENYIKEMEQELGVTVPRDLYFGGLTYPGKNLKEMNRIDYVLKQVEIIVKVATEYAIKHKLSLENPVFYRNLPRIEWDAYEYAALLNRQMQPPATESEITRVEKKLGVQLPPSYKAFLETSNGYWINILTCLMPVQHIDLANKLQPDALYYGGPEELSMDFSDYYKYNKNGRTNYDNRDINNIGSRLFNRALLLSEPEFTNGEDVDIAIIPYDPDYSSTEKSNGEWESFLSFFLRTNSFKSMMEFQYQDSIATLRNQLENGPPY